MPKPLLLLDENIGVQIANLLREQGYNVKSILEEEPGSKDELVLKQAVKEWRTLVTLDKDFGKLVYRDSNKHVGIIFLRLKKESAENIYKVLVSILSQHEERIQKKFVTASESKIRVK